MLNRDLRFHAQSLIDVGSSVAGFAGTVIAAIALRSYWALWVGGVAATAVNTILFMLTVRWRPRITFRWSAIKAMVTFGGGVSAANISTFITRNVDNVLLARWWGAAPLGLYDRAYKLMLFPLQNFTIPMARIILPVLARTRDDPARFRRAYLLFVQAIVLVTIPVIVVAAVDADNIVLLLMGERWHAAGPIFRWLAAAGAVLLVNDAAAWLLIAGARTRALLHWSLFAAVTVVLGFVIGLPWGPVGMAIAYCVGETARAPLLFAFVTKGTPVRLSDMVKVHAVTVSTLIAVVAARSLLPQDLPPIVRAVILTLTGYTAALAAQAITPSGREFMRLAAAWAGQSRSMLRARLSPSR